MRGPGSFFPLSHPDATPGEALVVAVPFDDAAAARYVEHTVDLAAFSAAHPQWTSRVVPFALEVP